MFWMFLAVVVIVTLLLTLMFPSDWILWFIAGMVAILSITHVCYIPKNKRG